MRQQGSGSMMHFEGDKELPRPPAETWPKLSDARFLVQCVPDVESVSLSEAGRAVCTIRPGFAFVRGTLELTLQVIEAVPESSVRLLLHTKGIGSSSDVEVTLLLTPGDGGTRVHWSVEIKNLGGLLKAVPQGLIKGGAQKVIMDVWTAVETRMAS
jgi:carbon monoxide dehydrogenase subunit G